MTAELVENTAQALRMVELVKFSMAEEAVRLQETGEWKKYVRDEGAEQPGTHPSTFRKFLEDYTREVRDRVPGGLSTGQLEDWVASYRWLTRLGFTVEQMTLLGTGAVKLLRNEYQYSDGAQRAVLDALAELGQHGKFHLPGFRKGGKIQPVLRVADKGDSYILRGITLICDGVPFRNQYPKEKLHWLSKRLRAAVEVEE